VAAHISIKAFDPDLQLPRHSRAEPLCDQPHDEDGQHDRDPAREQTVPAHLAEHRAATRNERLGRMADRRWLGEKVPHFASTAQVEAKTSTNWAPATPKIGA